MRCLLLLGSGVWARNVSMLRGGATGQPGCTDEQKATEHGSVERFQYDYLRFRFFKNCSLFFGFTLSIKLSNALVFSALAFALSAFASSKAALRTVS